MATLGGETKGELVVEGVPDDIVERLESRVAAQRWVGMRATSTCRAFVDERPVMYREPVPRASSTRIEVLAANGAVLEDVFLDFARSGRVRYRVRFVRARNVALAFGAGAAAAFVALGLVGHTPIFVVLAPFVFIALAASAIADARRRARRVVARTVGEEIAQNRIQTTGSLAVKVASPPSST